MTKKEVRVRVLQDGKPLALSRFTWDEGSSVFSTTECDLTLNFRGVSGRTFTTGSRCTFKTGSRCTFKTGSRCTFKTGYDCTFETGACCTFYTWSACTFKTGYCCTFNTGYSCTFKTGYDCTFETGACCTFNTGYSCTFRTGFGCTFRTGLGCVFDTRCSCTWVTEGKSYPFAPLLIQGSMWPVNVYRPGYLKIGCEDRTFEEWGRDAEKVAKEEEEVSPEVLEEYLGLIEVAKVWAEKKGWLLPK